jgi:hypothetical protein
MDAFRPICWWITPPSSGNALVDQLGRICIDKSASGKSKFVEFGNIGPGVFTPMRGENIPSRFAHRLRLGLD